MITRTTTAGKATRRAYHSHMRHLNQTLQEGPKIIMELKRENALKHKNALLASMVQTMREQGASDQAIRQALPGLGEFARCVDRKMSRPTSPNPEHPHRDPDPDEEALGVFLSQVEAQPVHWLWDKRIPLGKITLLDGDPGMGKSMLAIDLAARVSSGLPMPDGTPGPQGGVIVIAPEDDAGDTLRPRLETAGGDPSRVLLLNLVPGLDTHKMALVDRPFSLSHDLELLEKAIERTNARLVVLDPLMAVLGGSIDSSRDQHIREVFTPLAQLAERTGCAILIIRHLTKGTSHNALYRGAGSIGIIAAARTGLLVASDPSDETRRILATTKNNLSQRAPNLSYQIEANPAGIPSLHWLGENQQPVSTLLHGGTTLSLERQQILEVLRAADAPLGPQEVAQRTGQPEPLVRRTLSRTYEAREIARQSRGKYTTLDHPSLLQRSPDAHTTHPLDSSDSLDPLDLQVLQRK
jgi:AAA domain